MSVRLSGLQVCSVDNCEGAVQAKSMCPAHYQRQRKGMLLIPIRRQRVSPNMTNLERFLVHVTFTDDCWLWDSTRENGYGYFYPWRGGQEVLAHRWSYEYFVAPIPDGLQLDHLCRVRHCVRPEHLEPVTQRENILRGDKPAQSRAMFLEMWDFWRTHKDCGHVC